VRPSELGWRRLLRPADVAARWLVAARPHDGVSLFTETLFDVPAEATLGGRPPLRLVASAPVVDDLHVRIVSEDAAQRAEEEFVAAMDDEELARHPEATRGAASVPANHSPIAAAADTLSDEDASERVRQA